MENPEYLHAARAEKRGFIARIGRWYARFERPISSVSLVGGFVFDALTLTRVDLFWENIWVVGHMAAVAVCIFLINLTENMRSRGKNPERIHFWLINILQFFFGGILSTFLVYYFRSGTIAASWPFLLILLAAFVANERLKHHYSRLVFQVSLFFLSVFAFAIFIIPVMVHSIGPWIFVLSGIASIAVILLFLLLLRAASHERFQKSKWPLFASLGAIFIGINALYFYHLIPPLPLSLKGGGIYDTLAVESPGNYMVTAEPSAPWWDFFEIYRPVHVMQGTPLFAYTAVFSPAQFQFNVIHEWQHYNTQTGTWVTMGRVSLGVAGGADGGWRTFSEVTPTLPGKWRVNVKTSGGAVIGRIDFAVTFTSSTPPLQTSYID